MAGKHEPTRGSDEPAVSSEEPLTRGEPSYVTAECPVCAAPDAVMRTILLVVPYFDEVFETVFMCPACGFRHADTLVPRIGQPTEFSIRISQESDMFVRAVKSSSATVAVPDLGLLWEPGPASIAEVTNVEGLLRHFEDATRRAKSLFPEADAQRRADEVLTLLDDLIEGRATATLVMKDPYGNSALLGKSPPIVRRVLGATEAEELATGEYILQASDDGRPEKLRPARDFAAD